MSEQEVTPSSGAVPNDGSPEGHVEKMLGLSGDPKPEGEGESQVAQRPDNVPEKFWDAEKGEINTEALLKSQADGEAALRGKQNAEPKEGEEGEDVGEPNVEPNQTKAVENASAEWAEKGELSAETYKALESVGLSQDMVNDYIAGQQAIVSGLQSAAYAPFEGQEGYDEATLWAAENLSDDEIKAFDVQLTSTNPAIVAQGAKALKQKFEAEADHEPEHIGGSGGNGAGTGGTYKSSREMMKDMNSREYRTSQAFRDEVADKLARSNL
jgi:hypothetical protein